MVSKSYVMRMSKFWRGRFARRWRGKAEAKQRRSRGGSSLRTGYPQAGSARIEGFDAARDGDGVCSP